MASWWQPIWAAMKSRLVRPDGTQRMWFSGKTTAGVYVDPDTALKNATVWACVQYLSKTVASLPWHVHRQTEQGSDRAVNHPVDWLLYKRPCPDFGAFDWRRTMVSWVVRWGNAYAEIERTNSGQPYALWPIHPRRVAVTRDEAGGLQYEVWNEGGKTIIPAADMFHVRGLGDGPVGMSVMDYAAESIGWAQATQLFGSTYFSQGMNPTGVLEVNDGLSPEALELLRAEVRRLYSGPKGERTAILDAGMKFSKVQQAQDESQFVETRQHQVEEICRWFGVPPHKVMHMLRSTFSNIEHQSIEVVVDSIAPLAKAFEDEADYKLLRDNRGGFYSKIDLRALLRGDHASRGTYYKMMVDIGAMTLNEVRALEDLNSVGNGDTRFVSQNLQALDENGMPVPKVNATPVRDDDQLALPDNEENGRGRRLPN